jgi:hypothetical protein
MGLAAVTGSGTAEGEDDLPAGQQQQQGALACCGEGDQSEGEVSNAPVVAASAMHLPRFPYYHAVCVAACVAPVSRYRNP